MSAQFLISCSSSAARWLLPEVVLMTHASLTPFLLRVPSAALVQPSESRSELAWVTSRCQAGIVVSVKGERALTNGPFIGLPMPPTREVLIWTLSIARAIALRSGLSPLKIVGDPLGCLPTLKVRYSSSRPVALTVV